MGKSDELKRMADVIRSGRWAGLATLGKEGLPQASMVAYAVEVGFAGILLHLSRLAEHTGNLLERPRASLVISEPDPGHGDPQQLARVTLHGTVEPLARDSADYLRARERYLARLPDAEPLFGFGDFVLLRMVPIEARFVGGFARAYSFGPAELRRATEL